MIHGTRLTIFSELSTQEKVHEVDLSDNVDKVKQFANEEFKCVEGVIVSIDSEIINQDLDSIFFGIWVDNWNVHFLDE